jgi:hypothetical protein
MNADIFDRGCRDAATPPLMNAVEWGGKLDATQRVRTTLGREKR